MIIENVSYCGFYPYVEFSNLCFHKNHVSINSKTPFFQKLIVEEINVTFVEINLFDWICYGIFKYI